ncbi:hypothetical protein P7K49_026186 [Saguinus oedipus]|uniref:Uncharacterized protein n=1 Tax=Saguinus oedipus TaxID=9490 RepID=A0ABQ9UDF6_SAGOE|nr:hypothetical protein P7K49_026186 [Saguinus oedipus]
MQSRGAAGSQGLSRFPLLLGAFQVKTQGSFLPSVPSPGKESVYLEPTTSVKSSGRTLLCSEECVSTPPKTMDGVVRSHVPGFSSSSIITSLVQKLLQAFWGTHHPLSRERAAFRQTSAAGLLTRLPASFRFPLHTFSAGQAPWGA